MQSLVLYGNNTRYQDILVAGQWKAALEKAIWCSLSWRWNSSSPSWQESQQHPGLHWEEGWQQAKESDPTSLLSTGETTPVRERYVRDFPRFCEKSLWLLEGQVECIKFCIMFLIHSTDITQYVTSDLSTLNSFQGIHVCVSQRPDPIQIQFQLERFFFLKCSFFSECCLLYTPLLLWVMIVDIKWYHNELPMHIFF